MATETQRADMIVGPGQIIESVSIPDYFIGCYIDKDNKVRSSSYGYVLMSTDTKGKRTIQVKSYKLAEPVIEINSLVHCKVIKLFSTQVVCDILTVGDIPLKSYNVPKGVIKKEDIVVADVDVPIYELFRVGDIVRAEIVSLGDSKQYYLSTRNSDLGVTHALSLAGNVLVPISDRVKLIYVI